MPEYLNFRKSNCRNCYKCIRHCPVKSIRFTGNQAHIIGDECILCGHCFVVCPQNAKEIADGTPRVRSFLDSGERVVASVAPSFVAYFDGTGFDALRSALISLGFADAEETAIGATLVKREYEKQVREGSADVIISSCCHSANLLIEKYYPGALKYLSAVVSPMVAHARDIKRRRPGTKVVFVGPCLSKKDEATGTETDAVLTFDELARMFDEAGITPEREMDKAQNSRARTFPIVGGIISTMDIPDNSGYTFVTVDGVENCRAALADIEAGNVHKCFIEMSACAGSCIGGPVMEKHRYSPVTYYKKVKTYAGERDFDVADTDTEALLCEREAQPVSGVMPTEREIDEAMKKIGKHGPQDELNCGSCGYNTCREKAIAVCLGKADPTMCLPHLMDSAERLNNNILDNTPNGILVLNEEYEVQRINRAALRMFHIAYESDILGELVVRIMDPTPFFDVLENGKCVRGVREYYPEFQKHLELTAVHDKSSHQLIAFFRDVTTEEEEHRRKDDMSRKTVEVADRVVAKQMRIVQEIASLLGETTAETKIALTNLKDLMTDDTTNEE